MCRGDGGEVTGDGRGNSDHEAVGEDIDEVTGVNTVVRLVVKVLVLKLW